MTVKDDLRALVDQLDDEAATEVLEYLRWLLSEGEMQPAQALTMPPVAGLNGTGGQTAMGELTEKVRIAIHTYEQSIALAPTLVDSLESPAFREELALLQGRLDGFRMVLEMIEGT